MDPRKPPILLRLLILAQVWAPVPLALAAALAAAAPTLPVAGSRIIRVKTEPQLQAAMNDLRSGDTILLEDGTYRLTRSLYVNGRDNVTIRGNAGSTNVVLTGKGMDNADHGGVPFGVWSNGANTTIAHLTIRDTYDNEIIFNPPAQSPHVYSVRLLDSGSQFIKSNPANVATGAGTRNGVVEYCWFEYTGNPPADHGAGAGYFNGISAHAARDWTVRRNVFKNLHNPDGTVYSWNPAVLFWRNSSNTITEQNIFINVDRAVAYGLDNSTPYRDHTGGAVRNNFVYLAPGFFSASRKASSDGEIIAWNSPGTEVDHNTLLLNQNTFFSIEFRFGNTKNAAARNNLSDAPIHLRDSANARLSGNLETAKAGYFVEPAAGDLHLRSTATPAINQVPGLNSVTNDFDGEVRPAGGAADIGADELISLAAPVILDWDFGGSERKITFSSESNLLYALERSGELGRSWETTEGNIAGTGNPIEVHEKGDGAARQFYRIRASH